MPTFCGPSKQFIIVESPSSSLSLWQSLYWDLFWHLQQLWVVAQGPSTCSFDHIPLAPSFDEHSVVTPNSSEPCLQPDSDLTAEVVPRQSCSSPGIANLSSIGMASVALQSGVGRPWRCTGARFFPLSAFDDMDMTDVAQMNCVADISLPVARVASVAAQAEDFDQILQEFALPMVSGHVCGAPCSANGQCCSAAMTHHSYFSTCSARKSGFARRRIRNNNPSEEPGLVVTSHSDVTGFGTGDSVTTHSCEVCGHFGLDVSADHCGILLCKPCFAEQYSSDYGDQTLVDDSDSGNGDCSSGLCTSVFNPCFSDPSGPGFVDTDDCDIICNSCGTFLGCSSAGASWSCPFCPGIGVSIHATDDDLDGLLCESCDCPLAAHNLSSMLCDDCLNETS